MSVMEHHSKESGPYTDHASPFFPFSIVAGVEKGAKNRQVRIKRQQQRWLILKLGIDIFGLSNMLASGYIIPRLVMANRMTMSMLHTFSLWVPIGDILPHKDL